MVVISDHSLCWPTPLFTNYLILLSSWSSTSGNDDSCCMSPSRIHYNKKTKSISVVATNSIFISTRWTSGVTIGNPFAPSTRHTAIKCVISINLVICYHSNRHIDFACYHSAICNHVDRKRLILTTVLFWQQ